MTAATELKTWTFPDAKPKLDGPWNDEPDKAQWVDEATGLDCLIVRSHSSGALCGYVGVPPGHPWHGKDYDFPDLAVHGGLTYSDFCQEGPEDGWLVCHIPPPGRPANVWWLGFDCAHLMYDVAPRFEEIEIGLPSLSMPDYPKPTYKTFEYVQNEIRDLARQVKAAS